MRSLSFSLGGVGCTLLVINELDLDARGQLEIDHHPAALVVK